MNPTLQQIEDFLKAEAHDPRVAQLTASVLTSLEAAIEAASPALLKPVVALAFAVVKSALADFAASK